MSLTKKGYADQLRSLLYPNTTPDAKFSIQQAMLAFCQARDEYVKINVLRNKAETHIIPSQWLNVFDDIAIQYDGKRYFSRLPIKVIATPRDTGIYHIWPKDCEEQMLIPVTPAFLSMYRNSAALELEGEQGYYVQQNKIIYIQEMDVNRIVSMRVLAQSYDLDEYAFFPIDDSCLPEILRRTVELYQLQKQIPQDVTNDGIS